MFGFRFERTSRNSIGPLPAEIVFLLPAKVSALNSIEGYPFSDMDFRRSNTGFVQMKILTIHQKILEMPCLTGL